MNASSVSLFESKESELGWKMRKNFIDFMTERENPLKSSFISTAVFSSIMHPVIESEELVFWPLYSRSRNGITEFSPPSYTAHDIFAILNPLLSTVRKSSVPLPVQLSANARTPYSVPVYQSSSTMVYIQSSRSA